jgi:hypothetical protein
MSDWQRWFLHILSVARFHYRDAASYDTWQTATYLYERAQAGK